MKKSKLLAGLSAAAMALSMLSAVPAAAEETVLSDYHIKTVSNNNVNLFDAEGKTEDCEFDSISDITGITSVKFIVSVDEDIAQQAINNGIWLGGGLGTNSETGGWNSHEWCFAPYMTDLDGNPIDSDGDGIPDPAKECTFTKVSDGIYETVLFNEDGFFKDDDTYAQLWLQNWMTDVASLELLEVVLNPTNIPSVSYYDVKANINFADKDLNAKDFSTSINVYKGENELTFKAPVDDNGDSITAKGVTVFRIDLLDCYTEIPDLKCEVTSVIVDGKEFPVDFSKILYGKSQEDETDNYNIELYNVFLNNTTVNGKYDESVSPFNPADFTFSRYVTVKFNAEGTGLKYRPYRDDPGNDSSYDEPDSSYPDSSYPDNDSSATDSAPAYKKNSWYSEEPITDYLYNSPWIGENGKADNKDTGPKWNGTWNQFITASDDLSDTTVTFVIDTNGAEWCEDDDGNSVYDTGTFTLFLYGESSSDSDKNKLAFSDGESINDCEYTEENGVYTITVPAKDVVTTKDVRYDAHDKYAYTYGFNTQFGHIINAKYTAYVTGNTVIPTDENGNISFDKYYALTDNHRFFTNTYASGCTTEGRIEYYCDCGYSYEETLPALGHRYTDYWVLDKFLTCKQNGIASRRCLNCGDRTDITPIGKTSHAYEDIILEYSKGDKLGKVSHICAYCGDTYEEEVDVKRPISDAEVTLSKYSYTYNGGIFKPAVTVKMDGEKLTAGKDYTVTYDGSTEAGDANVFIKGIGDYEGYAEAEYTINPRSIVNCDVSLSSSSVYFNGKAVTPGVSVKVGNKTLTSDDYEVSYENNVRAGTATVIVTGKNNLKGNVTKTFEIKARSIKNCTVELPSTKQFFTGERIKPSVKVKCGGKTLPSDDYTVTYKNNLSAGTATVVVTGKNDLSGSVTKTFTINARSILNCNVTITSNPDNTAEPIVAVDYKGVSIYKGNYTVTYSEVSDGVIAVTITGKNNLRSTVTKNFEI